MKKSVKMEGYEKKIQESRVNTKCVSFLFVSTTFPKGKTPNEKNYFFFFTMKIRDDLLQDIENANLVGRGGAEFPTHLKWKFVKQAKGKKKYVVCNASEGELGLFKDEYILRHFTEKVFLGMQHAMDFLDTRSGYFNMNEKYYAALQKKLGSFITEYKKKGYDIKIFKESPSYIGGEETALLNAIEKKRVQPRIKPPYPSEKGLFGKPTLIHNVETLYNVSKVAEGAYESKRFYCLSGEIQNPGVYRFPSDWTIHNILEETKNIPVFPYFSQIGGSASGPVFNAEQMKQEKVSGAGSIEVYRENMDPKELLLKWFSFYSQESCGKCTPCREGTYQLEQLIKTKKDIPWKQIDEILEALETSFCALGTSVPVAVRSYRKNILEKNNILVQKI
jgi:NADH:ubiquinone oxidoreductase subunit F (NADH-binding)